MKGYHLIIAATIIGVCGIAGTFIDSWSYVAAQTVQCEQPADYY